MNNYKKALANLFIAAEVFGYDLETSGGDGINNVSSIKVNNFNIKDVAVFDAEDIDMLTELMAEYGMNEIKTVFSGLSPSNIFGEYHKDSYRFSRDNVAYIIQTAIADSSISMTMLESIEDKYIAKSFNVDSAFIYKGYYVTPYMIVAILEELISSQVRNDLLLRFYNHYIDKSITKMKKAYKTQLIEFLCKSFINGDDAVLNDFDNIREIPQ